MAKPAGWKVSIQGNKATVTVPADDLLKKKRREDGKREYRMPPRKLVAKLQDACPGGPAKWDYSDGWLEKDGKTCRFFLYRKGSDNIGSAG